MTNKIRVGVLYGGRSGEHEVSMISAASIIKHLDRSKYDPIPIGIDYQGCWYIHDLQNMDPLKGDELRVPGPGAKPFTPLNFLSAEQDKIVDVIFPVLHGPMGEDGTVQGLLELARLPYVGCGVLASALCMDKDFTKRIIMEMDIPTADYVTFRLGAWQLDRDMVLEEITDNLTFPMFVKPCNIGSSVGINKAKNEKQLITYIEEAFKFDTKLIIEQGMNIREVEVAVLENLQYGEVPRVSVAGEIATTHEFYSYEAKYCDEKSLTLTIPAHITMEQKASIKDYAEQIFDLLECEGMARLDFFIDKESGEVLFNELNTIPGFTHVSMYPMLWQASGLSYPELLTELIKLAQARYARRSALQYQWR